MPGKKIKFIAGFAIIIICLFTLVVSSSRKMSMYYLTVTELEAREIELANIRIKLAGKVVPESIIKRDGNRTVEFQIWEPINIETKQFSNTRTIRYTGVVPDTFRDRADVVLEGKINSEGIFVAETMLAKCPSKYESQNYDTMKQSRDQKTY